MRGLAALLVMIHHFTQGSSFLPFPEAFLSVDLFFCLSGFVLYKAYGSRIATDLTFRKFAAIRLVRLYPLYLVGTVVGGCVLIEKALMGLADLSLPETLVAFALNLFYLPFHNDGSVQVTDTAVVMGAVFPTNDPSWSLSFELAVNAVFFLLIKRSPRPVRMALWIAVASACIFLPLAGLGKGNLGWGSGLAQLATGSVRTSYGFFSGVVIAALPAPRLSLGRGTGLALGLLLAALCSTRVSGSYAVGLMLVPGMVWLGASIRLHSRTAAICARLGDLSYPIYCLHFPILSAMILFGLRGVSAIAVATVATLAASAAVLAMIDKPVRLHLQGPGPTADQDEPWDKRYTEKPAPLEAARAGDIRI
jgi:peptidoglycan/LPS O-acetylase OafA/YrhL